MKVALGSVRQRGLLSFRALPGDEKPRWRATPMGTAVHSSSLPIHLGERLYEVTPLKDWNSMMVVARLLIPTKWHLVWMLSH